MSDFTLIIRGISKEKAKEYAEELDYGSMQWARLDNGDLVTYPETGDKPCEITSGIVKTQNDGFL